MSNVKRLEHFVLPEHTNNLYKEEAISSISLTKNVADKINEIVDTLNLLSKTDLEWKHEQEGIIRKGVIYMKDNLLNSLNDLMELLRDSGFIDDRIEYHCDYLKARLDNIISAVESGNITQFEAEMVDIRCAWDEMIYSNAGESVRNQIIKALYKVNSSAYITSDADLIATPIGNGGLSLYFGNTLNIRIHPESKNYTWGAISDAIKDLIEINGNKATITINQFRKALVFNTIEEKLYIRGDIGGVEPGDIVLIDNSHSSVIGGELFPAYIKTRLNRVEKYESVIPASKQFLYIGSNGGVSFATADNGGLKVTVGGQLIGLFGVAETYAWSDIGSELGNNIVISADGKTADITINQYRRTLVFNVKDKKLYIRNFDHVFDINDYVLVQNAWSQPIGGAFVDLYTRTTAETALNKAGSGGGSSALKYPVNKEALMRLAEAQNAKRYPCDTFLYLTDPHLCEGADWETEFDNYMANIEETFKRSGAQFIVCGGDWIGNSDTQEDACYKLAYAQSRMKAITDKYYPVLGNHDTNYQGVDGSGDEWSGTLDRCTIANIMFPGRELFDGEECCYIPRTYYKFETNTTIYVVLDTGSDQNHTQLTDYDLEQLDWFNSLDLPNDTDSDSQNLVIFAHIVFDADGNYHPLVQAVMEDYDSDCADKGCGYTPIIIGGHVHEENSEETSVDPEQYNTYTLISRANLKSGGVPTFDIVVGRNFINFGDGNDLTV